MRRKQRSVTLYRSRLGITTFHYITRNENRCQAGLYERLMHTASFLLCSFLSSLSPWLRLKHDRQTGVQQATSTLRICVKADYRLGSALLVWSLPISLVRWLEQNGRNAIFKSPFKSYWSFSSYWSFINFEILLS